MSSLCFFIFYCNFFILIYNMHLTSFLQFFYLFFLSSTIFSYSSFLIYFILLYCLNYLLKLWHLILYIFLSISILLTRLRCFVCSHLFHGFQITIDYLFTATHVLFIFFMPAFHRLLSRIILFNTHKIIYNSIFVLICFLIRA